MSQSEKYVSAGSTRSLRNKPSSPKQNLAALRLGESHLRGIRSPTDPHSIASSSHKATMSQSEKKRASAGSTRSLRNNPSSPNQNFAALRLGESHLRGIRTPRPAQHRAKLSQSCSMSQIENNSRDLLEVIEAKLGGFLRWLRGIRHPWPAHDLPFACSEAISAKGFDNSDHGTTTFVALPLQ